MSDLQLSLIGLGIALVGGVFAYNKWQERKHRKLAERVFRSVQMSWRPPQWGDASPWMRMFRNARAWVA